MTGNAPVLWCVDVPTRATDGATLATFRPCHFFGPATTDVTPYSSFDRDENQLLGQLSAEDRAWLLADAEYIHLAAGRRLASVGDQILAVYLPESGVMSAISEMASGHRLAIAAIGPEGALGVGTVMGQRRYRLTLEVLVETQGYRLFADRFTATFNESAALRRVVLAHVSDLDVPVYFKPLWLEDLTHLVERLISS
jgi:hypothetical protein